MKCIDSIVEFIFDKIFQTNSMPELQLTSQKFNDSLYKSPSDKPIDITHSTILVSSLKRKGKERAFSPLRNKTLKFDETFNTLGNIKPDANDSGAPRFIQDSKDSGEIFVRNPDNMTDDESVYQDLSSLIKNIRKQSDIASPRKPGRKATLKEIIMKNKDRNNEEES